MALNHIKVTQLQFNKAVQIFKLLGLFGLFERYKANRLHSGITYEYVIL